MFFFNSCRVPLGVVVTGLLSYVWMYVLEQPDPAVVPYYREAVVYYAIASVVYLISEPFYVVSQILLFARLKVCSIDLYHNSTCNFLVLHVRRLMQYTLKNISSFCDSLCIVCYIQHAFAAAQE